MRNDSNRPYNFTVKILHILDHSVPLQSGYAFRSRAILEGQNKRGWRTTQVTSIKHKQASGAVPYEQIDGLGFYRTPQPKGRFAKLPLLEHWTVIETLRKRLDSVIETERPDILHAHSPALNGVAALLAGRRHARPVVYECRAFWEDAAVDHGSCREGSFRYRATRFLETYVFRHASAVTTICEGLRNEIVGRGIPRERIAVIPNAVDLVRFSLDAAPDCGLKSKLDLDGNVVLGFIGSFYAYEGLSLLIEAMKRIVAEVPKVRLLLIGGGRDEPRLRQMASTLGLAKSVIFAGRVPHDEVHKYYDLIDVFVYPRLRMRLTETVTPLKPLEAMARGRLVIASDVGGHRELIEDGLNGRLFRAGDRASLESVVLSLVRERSRWGELQRAGREFVEKERSWPASVARYEPVYQALLTKGPRVASNAASHTRI